jgi:hypothetical protein
MTGEAAVVLDPRPHETEGVVGDVVNTASRLQGMAPTGTVVVGEPTWWATRTVFDYEKLEPVQVKGKAQPLPVWRAVAPRSRLGVAVDQRPATPLVGRDQELDLLRRLYQQTRRERALQLVTLVGEPGIGKSRLVRELLRFVDDQPELVIWREGHCLSYGEGVTFWALGEIVKAQAGVLESDDAAVVTVKLKAAVAALVTDQDEREWLQVRLAPLLGLLGGATAPAEQAEQFTAWRRFLEAVAASGPLILVVEDLHWADDALLAFLEHLVGAVRGVTLLVVTTARPELYERHPGWPQDTERSTMIPLAALQPGDTARLIGSLLGRSRLPAEVEASRLERADGNPLYAEEYVRLLADRGLLAAHDQLRGTSGADLPFPPPPCRRSSRPGWTPFPAGARRCSRTPRWSARSSGPGRWRPWPASTGTRCAPSWALSSAPSWSERPWSLACTARRNMRSGTPWCGMWPMLRSPGRSGSAAIRPPVSGSKASPVRASSTTPSCSPTTTPGHSTSSSWRGWRLRTPSSIRSRSALGGSWS